MPPFAALGNQFQANLQNKAFSMRQKKWVQMSG